jgi:hypothetical protein
MTDIVDELRDRAYSHKAGDPLSERAAKEIERLRNGAVDARETVTLTDAERDAIEWAARWITTTAVPSAAIAHCHADSLRNLLERLK